MAKKYICDICLKEILSPNKLICEFKLINGEEQLYCGDCLKEKIIRMVKEDE